MPSRRHVAVAGPCINSAHPMLVFDALRPSSFYVSYAADSVDVALLPDTTSNFD